MDTCGIVSSVRDIVVTTKALIHTKRSGIIYIVVGHFCLRTLNAKMM